MNNIGIDTNNFYKFVCTTSLILSIYFFSCYSIYWDKYNDKIFNYNFQNIELICEKGYFDGISIDLTNLLKDSLTSINEYGCYYPAENATIISTGYYTTTNLNDTLKILTDSLNNVNKACISLEYKITELDHFLRNMERDFIVQRFLFVFLGFLFLITFFIGLVFWYKNKEKIDK